MLEEMIKHDEMKKASNQEKFHIKTNRNEFVKALSHVQTVVEKRNIIPILSNVLLIAENGKLTVTATDMDIIFSEQINLEVIENGTITVSAHLLYDIIRKLDDNEEIELLLKNQILQINASNCNFTLGTLFARDFPKVDDDGYEVEFSIMVDQLKDIIDKVKFSISNEETRYNLNGVFIHSGAKNMLQAVSTDGHRLSVLNLENVEGLKPFEGIIIPRKAILELRKVIDEFEGNVHVLLSPTKVKFMSEKFAMITKLIDAKFPSYETLIPNQNELLMKIKREQFIKAIDRVSTINNEKFRGIKLECENNKLTLSSTSDAGGAAKETINVEINSEEKFEIGFNARYLLESMSVLNDEIIVCRFKDSFSPAIISEESSKNYRHIVMPMRV